MPETVLCFFCLQFHLLCPPTRRNINYHSMEAILVLVIKSTHAVDSNEYLELITFDLSKAFDLVDFTVIIKMYFAAKSLVTKFVNMCV